MRRTGGRTTQIIYVNELALDSTLYVRHRLSEKLKLIVRESQDGSGELESSNTQGGEKEKLKSIGLLHRPRMFTS